MGEPAASAARSWAVVAAMAIVAHLPATRGGYILDDDQLLVSNPYVRTLRGLGTILTHELFLASAQPQPTAHFRPIAGLQYWVTWQLFGASAFAQHAYNLVLHGAVAAALFAALEAFHIGRRIAIATAVLFAVHPLTAVTTAYVGGRMEMLGWLVFLVGLARLARVKRPVGAAIATFLTTLIAAHSRETLVVAALAFPLALLSNEAEAPSRRRFMFAAIGGGMSAVASIALLRATVGVHALGGQAFGAADALVAFGAVVARFTSTVVAPTDLAMQLSLPDVGPSGAALIVLTATLMFSGAMSLVRREARARGLVSAAAVAFAATIAMTATNVLARGFYSDRYSYGLALEIALATAGVLQAFAVRAKTWLDTRAIGRFLPSIVGVAALALVPLTWSRDALCRDQSSLRDAMIAERPNDPETLFAHGILLFYDGDVDRAYPLCAAYAKARPRSDRAHLCIGAYLFAHGHAGEAVPYLSAYASARPGDEIARAALDTATEAAKQR